MTTRAFSRERLYARLDTARLAPVTLVVADEGLGKSTLMRDYLALRRIEHVSFAATPEHAAPAELVRGLAAALGEANPAMARSAGNAALQLERADGEAAALAWAREHLSGITATIVLDELHHVLGEPRCASFLSGLIEATQPQIRWIVAVRDATALPVPRWLASGVADLPLESGELRVQPDEIRAAFGAAGLALSAADARDVYQRTDGWALGLSVALATGDLAVRVSRAQVYDGLVETAFAALSNDDCDSVCELAATGRFDASIVEALECEPTLIERLRAYRLVFAAQDGAHAFFEPCRVRVLQRLDRFGGERRGIVFDRAAGALERAGRWRDALALRVRSGDQESIAAALDRRGFSALDHGEVASVGTALKALAVDTLDRHPVALALNAALASLDESFDVSEAWFRMAIDAARDGERRDIVLRYGMDLVRRGRHDVVELLEAETARGETRTNPDADASLWALLGTAYAETHRLDAARDAASRALRRLPGVVDDSVRARVLHQASYVALNDGDPALAKSLAERALARADASFLYDLAARALSVLFNVAMLQDEDVASARDALMRLEEAGRKAGSEWLRLYAILNAYAIEVDAGDTAALARLDLKLEEMQVLLTTRVSEALLPAQALCAAWDGRFAHAYDMLAVSAEMLFDEDRIAYRWAETAVYGAAAGKTIEACAAIGASRAILLTLEREKPLAVRTAAYLALAETLLGNDDAARDAIAQAYVAAASGTAGRARSLVDAVAAYYDCRTGGAAAFLALGEKLDALERCELRGVARFIGRLPVPDAGAQGAANRARRGRAVQGARMASMGAAS